MCNTKLKLQISLHKLLIKVDLIGIFRYINMRRANERISGTKMCAWNYDTEQ